MLVTHVKFDDKTKEMIARNAVATDASMAYMAQDIEILIKTGGITPFKQGKLRGDTYHEKLSVAKYRVNVPVEYAAAQEAGVTHGSPMVHYTTPGTGKGFFKAAIEATTPKAKEYVEQAAKVAGIN